MAGRCPVSNTWKWSGLMFMEIIMETRLYIWLQPIAKSRNESQWVVDIFSISLDTIRFYATVFLHSFRHDHWKFTYGNEFFILTFVDWSIYISPTRSIRTKDFSSRGRCQQDLKWFNHKVLSHNSRPRHRQLVAVLNVTEMKKVHNYVCLFFMMIE